MNRASLAGLALLVVACSSENGTPDPETTTSSSSSASTSSGGGGSGGGGGGSGGGGSGGGGGGSGGGGSGGGGSGGGSSSGSGGGNAAVCPEAPSGVDVGFDVGDQLADVVVKDCEGQDYALTELCGKKGLHVFAAHGWCPLCKSVAGQQEALHDKYAASGLGSVNIVVQTAAGGQPDAAYCKLWREQFGQDDVITLYDPTGASLAIWPGGSSSLHAFVNADRVIVQKLEHTSDLVAIEGGIQKAIGP